MWLSHTIFSLITAVTKIYHINEQQLFYYGDFGVYQGFLFDQLGLVVAISWISLSYGWILDLDFDLDLVIFAQGLPLAAYLLLMTAVISIFYFLGLIQSFPLPFLDNLTDHLDNSTFLELSGYNSMHLQIRLIASTTLFSCSNTQASAFVVLSSLVHLNKSIWLHSCITTSIFCLPSSQNPDSTYPQANCILMSHSYSDGSGQHGILFNFYSALFRCCTLSVILSLWSMPLEYSYLNYYNFALEHDSLSLFKSLVYQVAKLPTFLILQLLKFTCIFDNVRQPDVNNTFASNFQYSCFSRMMTQNNHQKDYNLVSSRYILPINTFFIVVSCPKSSSVCFNISTAQRILPCLQALMALTHGFSYD